MVRQTHAWPRTRTPKIRRLMRCTPPLLLFAALHLLLYSSGSTKLASDGHVGRLSELSGAGALPAELFLPHNWPSKAPTPLIVFLHGRGESGGFAVTNAQSLPLQLLANTSFAASFPFAVLVPQCPASCAYNNGWQPAVLQQVTALVSSLVSDLAIDATRVYLAGQSMGGNGAWLYAAQQRKLFAATAVICGYVHPHEEELVSQRLKREPIAVFHSADDVVIPVEASDTMVRLLRAEGNQNVMFTRYEHAPGPPMEEFADLIGHGAYEIAFRDQGFYAWLLQQRCASCGPSATHWRPLHSAKD